MSIDELMEQFPVSRKQVKAVLEFAARSFDAPVGPTVQVCRSGQRHPAPRSRCQRGQVLGIDKLKGGALLDAREAAGFEDLLKTEKNIHHQQDLSRRKIAMVVLGKARRQLIRLMLLPVAAAVDAARPGSFTEVVIPER
jgi:hypothetical protein